MVKNLIAWGCNPKINNNHVVPNEQQKLLMTSSASGNCRLTKYKIVLILVTSLLDNEVPQSTQCPNFVF